MDGLVHVGGGTISFLERLALQVEGSSLFVDEFLRALEVLGHLQVQRDEDLRPVAFEAPPTTSPVFQIDRSTSLLVAGPSQPVRPCSEKPRSEAGPFDPQERPQGAARGTASRTSVCRGRAGCRRSRSTRSGRRRGGRSRDVADGRHLVHDSGCVRSRSSLPGAKRTERFHLQSSSWVPCVAPDLPGAYRHQTAFMRTCVHVSAEELAVGCGAAVRRPLAGTRAAVRRLPGTAVDLRRSGHRAGGGGDGRVGAIRAVPLPRRPDPTPQTPG